MKNKTYKIIVITLMGLFGIFMIVCSIILLKAEPKYMDMEEADKYEKTISSLESELVTKYELHEKYMEEDIYANLESDVTFWIESVMGNTVFNYYDYYNKVKDLYTANAQDKLPIVDVTTKDKSIYDFKAAEGQTFMDISDINVYYKKDKTNEKRVYIMATYTGTIKEYDTMTQKTSSYYQLQGEFVYVKEIKKWQLDKMYKNNVYNYTYKLEPII